MSTCRRGRILSKACSNHWWPTPTAQDRDAAVPRGRLSPDLAREGRRGRRVLQGRRLLELPQQGRAVYGGARRDPVRTSLRGTGDRRVARYPRAERGATRLGRTRHRRSGVDVTGGRVHRSRSTQRATPHRPGHQHGQYPPNDRRRSRIRGSPRPQDARPRHGDRHAGARRRSRTSAFSRPPKFPSTPSSTPCGSSPVNPSRARLVLACWLP